MTLEPAGFWPVRSGASLETNRSSSEAARIPQIPWSFREANRRASTLVPLPTEPVATTIRNALESRGFHALPSRFESIPSFSPEADFAESAWNLRDFGHPRGGSKRLRANSLAPRGTPRNPAGSKHFRRSKLLDKFVTNASKRLGSR